MADFRTHVTTSSVLGMGYAGMGLTMGFSMETSLVAGGLCGVSGMLPDLDSDTGIPIRESTGFAAGIVPMLLVDRFHALGMPYDRMILVTALLYFLIRFAGASLLGRFSVHRGMFHSIPAALTFAGLAFLLCGPANDVNVRYFKAGAVFFGVMSHLCLDELYSIEWKGGSWRLKRSFGTAVKLWSKNGWANFSAYAKLLIVGAMVAGEPSVNSYLDTRYPEFANKMRRFHSAQEEVIDNVRARVGVGHDDAHAVSATTQSQPTATPQTEDGPWTSQFPSQRVNGGWTPTPTQPSPPVQGGFTPNAGANIPGSASPIYRAGGNYAPR